MLAQRLGYFNKTTVAKAYKFVSSVSYTMALAAAFFVERMCSLFIFL